MNPRYSPIHGDKLYPDEISESLNISKSEISRALTPYYAIPEQKGVYTVFSTDSNYVDGYTVQFMNEETCTCPDFVNRRVQNSDRCKHIWVVLLRVINSLVPAPTLDPDEWIERQIENDISQINMEDSSSVRNRKMGEKRLRSLRKRVGMTVDTKSAYNEWREIRQEFGIENFD